MDIIIVYDCIDNNFKTEIQQQNYLLLFCRLYRRVSVSELQDDKI